MFQCPYAERCCSKRCILIVISLHYMKPAKFKFYRRICIGNRMVSNAMRIKHARVSFPKGSNLWPLLENCFKLIGWFYHHIVFPPIGSVYYRFLHCNNTKLHCYYKKIALLFPKIAPWLNKLHCCLITALKSTNHSGGRNIFMYIINL